MIDTLQNGEMIPHFLISHEVLPITELVCHGARCPRLEGLYSGALESYQSWLTATELLTANDAGRYVQEVSMKLDSSEFKTTTTGT